MYLCGRYGLYDQCQGTADEPQQPAGDGYPERDARLFLCCQPTADGGGDCREGEPDSGRGGTIIDIGACSTRPGAERATEAEEIGTGEEIDPNQIVDHRADIADEYNESFVETDELESLW